MGRSDLLAAGPGIVVRPLPAVLRPRSRPAPGPDPAGLGSLRPGPGRGRRGRGDDCAAVPDGDPAAARAGRSCHHFAGRDVVGGRPARGGLRRPAGDADREQARRGLPAVRDRAIRLPAAARLALPRVGLPAAKAQPLRAVGRARRLRGGDRPRRGSGGRGGHRIRAERQLDLQLRRDARCGPAGHADVGTDRRSGQPGQLRHRPDGRPGPRRLHRSRRPRRAPGRGAAHRLPDRALPGRADRRGGRAARRKPPDR